MLWIESTREWQGPWSDVRTSTMLRVPTRKYVWPVERDTLLGSTDGMGDVQRAWVPAKQRHPTKPVAKTPQPIHWKKPQKRGCRLTHGQCVALTLVSSPFWEAFCELLARQPSTAPDDCADLKP